MLRGYIIQEEKDSRLNDLPLLAQPGHAQLCEGIILNVIGLSAQKFLLSLQDRIILIDFTHDGSHLAYADSVAKIIDLTTR